MRYVNDTALVIALAYAAAVALAVAVVLVVAGSTLRPERDLDVARAARRETTWLWVVVAALVALLAATILYVPYRAHAHGDVQHVGVTGVQFSWAVSPAAVVAGRPVKFTIRSNDVNHGLGIYDPRGVLVTQVQVMPGEEQRLVWTFREAGTYTFVCLEFCGAAHHDMVSTFEVVER